jgi:uncharacterized membrane protein (DUF2068 family)
MRSNYSSYSLSEANGKFLKFDNYELFAQCVYTDSTTQIRLSAVTNLTDNLVKHKVTQRWVTYGNR